MTPTINCGKGWGIGTNIQKATETSSYGFPESNDPHCFYPDEKCCTKAEMDNWRKAKKEWTKGKIAEQERT